MIKHKLVFCAVILLVLIAGCAGMQTDNDPKRAYLVALEQYIVIGDMYLEHKNLLNPDDAIKIKTLLLRADMALDAWKIALSLHDHGSKGQLDTIEILESLAVFLPRALEAIE